MAKVVERGGAVKYIPERGRLLDDEQRAANALSVAVTFFDPPSVLHWVKKEIGDEASSQRTDFSRLLLQLFY
jgi:hypothetical protein